MNKNMTPDKAYMTAGDAIKILEVKTDNRKHIIDDIIRAIQHKIKLASTMGMHDIVYALNKADLLMRHWNDKKKIMNELVRHFRRQRFYVQKLKQFKLYVSWRYNRK